MHKILVVAAREYRASVQTKSFLISLIIMPVFMGGSILVQLLLKEVGDTRKDFVLVDRTPQGIFFQLIGPEPKTAQEIMKAVPEGTEKPMRDPGRNSSYQFRVSCERLDPGAGAKAVQEKRYELSEKVRKGTLFGFAEIGPEVGQTHGKKGQGEIRYQTNSPTYQPFRLWLQVFANQVIFAKRFQDLGIPPDKIGTLLQPVLVTSTGLSEKNEHGDLVEEPQQTPGAAYFVPFGLVMLMFMVVMVGATPLMQGILEEKMQRIAEVLLGSISPFGLMMGKLLGMVGVALTLAGVYLGGAYWAAHYFGFAGYLPADLLLWFLVFLVLAVVMFGSLFIAVGAACSDIKETQALLMPVMLVIMVPIFLISNIIQDPNSPMAFWVSLFPPATPMLMIARQAVPPHIPFWQPLLGVFLVLGTTVLFVYAAGRIFRVGILLQGKGARFRDLLRWAIRG